MAEFSLKSAERLIKNTGSITNEGVYIRRFVVKSFTGSVTNVLARYSSSFQQATERVKFATGYLRQDTFELDGVMLGGYRRLWGCGAFVPGLFWGGGQPGLKETSRTAHSLISEGRYKDALLELFNIRIDAWNMNMVREGALAFNMLENFHGTLALLSKIPSQRWTVSLFNSAGIAFNETEQFDKTIALFEYLPRKQWDARIIASAAIAYAELGRRDDAVTLFTGASSKPQQEHEAEAARRLHNMTDLYPAVVPLLHAIEPHLTKTKPA